MRKGQTAMEYLMTYGWAILIIMVVLAVLFYLGMLNPPTPGQCLFSASITCISSKISASGGNLTLVIGQGTGHTINVTGVACSDNMTEGYVPTSTYSGGGSVMIDSGSQATVAIPGDNIHVECLSGGAAIVDQTVGSNYIGNIYINYTESDTQISHIAVGQFMATYDES